jgi:hypothetical protein
MMKFLQVLFVLLLTVLPSAVFARSVTFYLDGARVEREVVAAKGYLEMQFPPGMEAGSLRVRPLHGASLARVEVVPARPDRKVGSDLAGLAERRDLLTDRLQALAVREEIFRAAAKSQSGKAPRKTKNNREPLEEIRKGTEFAIAQLEGVYRLRRKAENELKVVEMRLSALKEAGNVGGCVARVWFTGKEGRAVVSYLQPTLKWTPSYDFRVNSGTEVEMVLYALLPQVEKGANIAVVPALLAEASTEQALPAAGEGPARITSYRFPIENVRSTSFPQPALSFSFRNSSGKRLPPGDATCYRQGEYIGKTAFTGSLPGESGELGFGKLPVAAR